MWSHRTNAMRLTDCPYAGIRVAPDDESHGIDLRSGADRGYSNTDTTSAHASCIEGGSPQPWAAATTHINNNSASATLHNSLHCSPPAARKEPQIGREPGAGAETEREGARGFSYLHHATQAVVAAARLQDKATQDQKQDGYGRKAGIASSPATNNKC